MNTFKGPFRMAWEDMRFMVLLMLSVTTLLFGFYIMMGMLLKVEGMRGVLFGPFYGLLVFYPLQVIKHTFPTFISFGGTRKQFVSANICVSLIFIVIGMFYLNILYAINQYFHDMGINTTNLFHLGDLIEPNHFIAYFWTDMLWGIFIIGLGMAVASVWHFFGTPKLLYGFTVLVLAFLAWWTLGYLTKFISFIVNEHFVFVHVLAGIGVIGIAVSYFLMRNGPIERGAHIHVNLPTKN
ncbi:hypothetical protein [Alkalihalobacillus pseudalcaliphilus]|uniref:hypothetical protein n=1 Tax=Alkalihalobacillus pseudalcaliphilus TaxID=79884 RepID=UPI00064DDBC2|nr:hypothetical protein [Alkalihalobacillus pseudalcaliphilus]KMK75893.1 hypothetical protein AB990_11570 [Alkalihalobacillus pseudalcaliphilus]